MVWYFIQQGVLVMLNSTFCRILSNKKWLRNDLDKTQWMKGMVRFSTQANTLFLGSILSQTARTLTRTPLSGCKSLDNKRAGDN